MMFAATKVTIFDKMLRYRRETTGYFLTRLWDIFRAGFLNKRETTAYVDVDFGTFSAVLGASKPGIFDKTSVFRTCFGQQKWIF